MRGNKYLRAILGAVSAIVLISTIAIGLASRSGVANASASNDHWVPFSQATWVNGVGEGSKFGLVTTSTKLSDGSVTYGGIRLKGKYTPSNPADIATLSFDFNANQTGASGGSPRLVVQFSDGGNAQLRPLSWTQDTWTTVDGMSGTDWDNTGGCGGLYAATWSAVKACHSNAMITSIFAVNDSGWMYPSTGEQIILDNITVNDNIASGPGSTT